MDPTKTWMLLQVAKEALGYPHLKPLHDVAMKELVKITESVTPKPEPAKVEVPQRTFRNPAEPEGFTFTPPAPKPEDNQ